MAKTKSALSASASEYALSDTFERMPDSLGAVEIVQDKAAASALINRVCQAITVLRSDMHQAVVTAVWHYGKHGDYRLVDRLYQAMSPTMRQSLAQYLRNINVEVAKRLGKNDVNNFQLFDAKMIERNDVKGLEGQKVRSIVVDPTSRLGSDDKKKAREEILRLAPALAKNEGTWSPEPGKTAGKAIVPFDKGTAVKATITVYTYGQCLKAFGRWVDAARGDYPKDTQYTFSDAEKDAIVRAWNVLNSAQTAMHPAETKDQENVAAALADRKANTNAAKERASKSRGKRPAGKALTASDLATQH